MLTIFSSPRPLTEERFLKIQMNSLKSWNLLRPRPEIILFGDVKREKGIEKLVKFGCDRWHESVKRNQWGTPLLGDLMIKAQSLARHPLVAWVNTDIILRDDFMRAIEVVSSQLREFLIVGAKWRLYGDPPDIDFSTDYWQRYVGKLCKHGGERQPRSGSNYQVFSKGLFRGKLYDRLEDRPKSHIHKDFPIEYPPIAWGRIRMDTWLVWQALRRGIPVVDVTDAVLAVHQDHRHIGEKVIKQDSGSVEIRLQDKLTERRESGGGRISNATWILDKNGRLKKK
jgi:hypothetical protein